MRHDPLSIEQIAAWKRRFSQAADEQQLVDLARQFVASLAPESQAMLRAPPGVPLFAAPEEVLEFALHLTQLEMSLAWEDAEVARTVRAVGAVFIEAGRRLTGLSEARVLRRFDEQRAEGPVNE
ncbi:MAG TPA: hypothetical protein VM122_02910 [Usitatibacter sp.]|nr:hypothetical protein [Usitatibacter sp.]